MPTPELEQTMGQYLPPQEEQGLVYEPPVMPSQAQKPPLPLPPAPVQPEMVGVRVLPSRRPELTPSEKTTLGTIQQGVDTQREHVAAQRALEDEAANAYLKAAKDDEEMQANYVKASDDVNKVLEAKHSELERDLDELNKHPVTPKDFSQLWAEKSTGQKILAGIGMALSHLGQNMSAVAQARLGNAGAFSQYKNPVIGFINDTIEKDVRKQQALHDALQTRYAASRASLGDAQKIGADRLDNMDKLRILSWEKSKKMFEYYKHRAQSAEQIAALEDGISKAELAQQNAYNQMMARAQQRAAGSTQGVVQIGNQRIAMPLDKALKIQKQQQEANLAQGKFMLDAAKYGLEERKLNQEVEDAAPSVPGLKKTGEKAPRLNSAMTKDLVDKAGAMNLQLRLLDEAEALASKGTAWSPEDRARGNQLQKDLSDARRIAKQMGVPQVYELEMLESLMPNPVGLNKFFTTTKYRVMKQAARKEANDTLRPYGYTLESSASRSVQPLTDTSNLTFKK